LLLLEEKEPHQPHREHHQAGDEQAELELQGDAEPAARRLAAEGSRESPHHEPDEFLTNAAFPGRIPPGRLRPRATSRPGRPPRGGPGAGPTPRSPRRAGSGRTSRSRNRCWPGPACDPPPPPRWPRSDRPPPAGARPRWWSNRPPPAPRACRRGEDDGG